MLRTIIKKSLASLFQNTANDINSEDVTTLAMPSPENFPEPIVIAESTPPTVSTPPITPYNSPTALVRVQQCSEGVVDLVSNRYPKRKIIEQPTDIYASRNIPEIFAQMELHCDDEDLNEAISFKGPLQLGGEVSEAHHEHHINPLQLVGASQNISDARTGRILFYKVLNGWSNSTGLIYDNKGNRANDPDADFQICRVRRKAINRMYDVHFTDWTHLCPLEMSWAQLTRNGSNEIMVEFLSRLEKVASHKWQSLGGKKTKRQKPIAKSEVQAFIKQLSIAQEQKVNDQLLEFIAHEAPPLLATTEGSGCMTACLINILRLDSCVALNDGLNGVLDPQMLASLCEKEKICALVRCKCESAIDYLLAIYAEVSASDRNKEKPECYVLYNPRINHGVSIDFRLKLIYDSGSEFKKPYHFGVEVLALLGFERSDLTLELRRITCISKLYAKKLQPYRVHVPKQGPKKQMF